MISKKHEAAPPHKLQSQSQNTTMRKCKNSKVEKKKEEEKNPRFLRGITNALSSNSVPIKTFSMHNTQQYVLYKKDVCCNTSLSSEAPVLKVCRAKRIHCSAKTAGWQSFVATVPHRGHRNTPCSQGKTLFTSLFSCKDGAYLAHHSYQPHPHFRRVCSECALYSRGLQTTVTNIYPAVCNSLQKG